MEKDEQMEGPSILSFPCVARQQGKLSAPWTIYSFYLGLA